MNTEQTVFIVDDDAAAVESVAALVKSMRVRAETYGSAEDFLARYDGHARGCLVTDMRMPGLNGLELQERLKQSGVDLPVVVITAYGKVPLAVAAMKNGAVMFLEKSCSERELSDAIASALALEGEQREKRARQQQLQERLTRLSADEHKVLEALLEGTPNKIIALRLGIALRTVEKRRAAVMRKLEMESLAELVRVMTHAASAPAVG